MTDAAISCPYCEAFQPGAPSEPGTAIDCVRCDRSFLTPERAAAPERAATEPSTGRRRLPGEVSASISGLAAALLTAVFYLGLVGPLSESRFGELLGARGWVPYVITGLAFWCGILLAAKFIDLRRQMKVLEVDLLPESIDERITPDNAPLFLTHLDGIATTAPGNYLVERLRRAIRYFEVRRQAVEVVEQLSAEARSDEYRVDSSFTLIRVFIWAIPILGFIGTVMGIGAAVGGFSATVDSAANIEGMKGAIGNVTAGLGLAFDTTLLALVVSILIMFPTSALQRAEEGFLEAAEDFCRERFVRRLDDASESPREEMLDKVVDRLAARLLEAMGQGASPRNPGA